MDELKSATVNGCWRSFGLKLLMMSGIFLNQQDKIRNVLFF